MYFCKVKSNKKQHTKKAILTALEKSLGVVTTACRQVGINRTTYYKYLKEDKEFAKRCYNDCFNRTVIKVNKQTLEQWDDDDIGTFLDLVDEYITKHADTFEERRGNEPIVNKIIENLDEVQDISEKEKDVDFTNDDWKKGREEEPMTEPQRGFLEKLITQAIDKGLDELASEAKQYLNSGNTSKVTCSDWINKLKNAL